MVICSAPGANDAARAQDGGTVTILNGDLNGDGLRDISTFSSVSGGQLNRATGGWAAVSGGRSRQAPSNHDWRAGEAFEEE